MSESTGTRWWENYLVRYFLPSLVGMIILRWIDLNTNGLLSNYIPFGWEDFKTPNLIAWLLFGSLYCYLASYPILVFHATRVLDFKDIHGNPQPTLINPYTATVLLAIIALFSAWHKSVLFAFVGVIAFSIFQVYRLYKSFNIQTYGFNKGYEASIAYAYLNKLSKRRGIIKESKQVNNEDEDNVVTDSNQLKDLADSYKHLREHGNTAFIFLLELTLCPICYVVLSHETPYVPFSILSILLFIWVLPSALVHWLGQHLERRYSLFKH